MKKDSNKPNHKHLKISLILAIIIIVNYLVIYFEREIFGIYTIPVLIIISSVIISFFSSKLNLFSTKQVQEMAEKRKKRLDDLDKNTEHIDYMPNK